MIEEDYQFHCPYCASQITIRLDRTGGLSQDLCYDCEVCCRPIQIRVVYSGDKVVSFSADAES